MNRGTSRGSRISGGHGPVWVESVDMLVYRCQPLFGYEWIPSLSQLVERNANFGFRLCVNRQMGNMAGEGRHR